MTFAVPDAAVDATLFLLRVVLALVFLTSGWSHAREPEERGESIGFPPAATLLLGIVEVGAASMLILGLWVQPAALLLGGVMVGAIYHKVFVWDSGFWGEEGGGWYYDLFYLVASLVIFATGGGGWVLAP